MIIDEFKFNIICVGSSYWDDTWRRRQYMTTALSKTCKVLYLEPCFSIKEFWRFIKDFIKYYLFSKMKVINKNLYVFPLLALFPFGRIKLFSSLNKIWLLFFVKKIQKRLNLDRPILIIWDFWEGDKFIGNLGEILSVYDCYDEFSTYSSNKSRKILCRNKEEQICRKVDLIFVTSKNLLNSKKVFNRSIFHISNGVDINLYSNQENLIKNDPLIDLPHPRIGYMISNFAENAGKTDFSLIEYMATSRKDWTIEIVGKYDEKDAVFKKLGALANVHFTGFVQRRYLPNYIMNFDVAIIPFLINEQTNNIFPLKIFEYFACGKPVVSTAIPDLVYYNSVFPGIIKISHNYDNFILNIESLLLDDSKFQKERRLSIANENSWEKKASQILEIIDTEIKSDILLFPDEIYKN